MKFQPVFLGVGVGIGIGIELKILKKLFSDKDAALFLAMRPKLETALEVALRIDKREDGVTDQLEDMAERGLLFRTRRGGSARYAAIPFVHGLFEFQVKNLDRELAEMVISNYFAAVDRDACTGCEACLERCQMEAIRMDSEDLAVIDRNRCIGCGLCVSTCPTAAMKLVPKPAAQHVTPPANSAEQMRTMAKNRGLL